MTEITLLRGKSIILGVTGSIACYKAIDLASKLTQAGAQVDVVLSHAAQEFVTPLAFQSITGRPVYTDLWAPPAGGGLPTHVAHIGLAERADLLAIIPATAHTIGKLAHGLADDLLSITALALNPKKPFLIAPAGDGNMLSHPAVIENLRILQSRGATIIEPETGRNASGLIGRGRLPETPDLMGALRAALGRTVGLLIGRRVIVTAGGTNEPLDPVRYITNRSSGKQGYAVAQAAIDAGAQVMLITTPTGLSLPVGATVIKVESAAEMLQAVLDALTDADALIMAAAVADYRPAEFSDKKIKKSEDAFALKLIKTADILHTVGQVKAQTHRPRVLVGFAAETNDLVENAIGKLERKNADFIVANDITRPGAGFAVDTNVVTILGRDGSRTTYERQSKTAVGEIIIDRIAAILRAT